jgi:hypothetical protein
VRQSNAEQLVTSTATSVFQGLNDVNYPDFTKLHVFACFVPVRRAFLASADGLLRQTEKTTNSSTREEYRCWSGRC